MADHITEAFLTQWNQSTGIRGDPGVHVLDHGKQLTSDNNKIVFPDKDPHINWDWERVETLRARVKTKCNHVQDLALALDLDVMGTLVLDLVSTQFLY